MVTWDHVTRAEVLRAIQEYDRLGPEAFFAEHGFARTTTYELLFQERRYPPKAILGTAYEFATGPCTYTGLSMRQSHTNMGVTGGEFDAFMDDLVATLDGFNVGKAEQDELLNKLRPMRADIVEVDSPQVGTPLPSAFTPAPPL